MAQEAEEKQVRCWISLGGHDVELKPGETVIGRHDSCHVVLDDPLASRRHAVLRFSAGRLTVEDLGSVNGVLVNERRVRGQQALLSGDEVRLGNQRIIVHVGMSVGQVPGRRRLGAQTLTSATLLDNGDDESTVVREGEALDTLALVAEKVLAMGRGQEAERILRKALESVREHVLAGEQLDPDMLSTAAEYAVRIAEATGNRDWVDYVFEVYAAVARVLPARVVDRLYSAVRSVSEVKLDRLREYLQVMQAKQDSLGPSERFLLRRIEGLERIVGL